jgi:hypothetical protein
LAEAELSTAVRNQGSAASRRAIVARASFRLGREQVEAEAALNPERLDGLGRLARRSPRQRPGGAGTGQDNHDHCGECAPIRRFHVSSRISERESWRLGL